MVKERMDLLELLHKGGMDGDVDFLREALRVLVEGIMDAEVSSRIGAEYGERSPERVTQRNGYRSRAWDTRVGTMKLHIPKLREGSYFPSLLEPRRRSERALLAVIQQAYVEGVSTRRVDDLQGPKVYLARCRASVRSWTWWWMASWTVRWTVLPELDAMTRREAGRIASAWWRRRSMRGCGRSVKRPPLAARVRQGPQW